MTTVRQSLSFSLFLSSSRSRDRSFDVPNAVAPSPSVTHILEWLAISLTPGLGPTKARKLVEHFGSAEAVFQASLTELESTGMQAVSAQSIATGKSAELAREEIARAAAAGVTVLSLEDP
jgi:predicted Rossmann fold nucleotide-binding protein DprA/Smf involved in DNA uptake